MTFRRVYFAAAELRLRHLKGSLQHRKITTTNSRLDKCGGAKAKTIGSQLFSQEFSHPVGKKITIVGAGQVGMAASIALLTQNVTNEICIFDLNEKKVRGEALDLQHGSMYLNSPKVMGTSNYADTACSRICIVTAGVTQKQNETRLQLVERNCDIFKELIPKLVEHSPDTILLIATNPVDVMSYVAWKLSKLPKKRIVGSGTTLDSSRFCQFIASRLGVSPSACNGCIIGEHGDSSVAVWSGVEVGGVRLQDFNPSIGVKEDPEKWHEIHKQVIEAGYQIRQQKGYTSWGIGLCISGIAAAILHNTDKIMPVSTMVKDQQCIEDEIFLSLPCTLNASGISAIVQLTLNDLELKALHKSAKIIADAQSKVKL